VCVSHTLKSGFRSGLWCGLGVAIGDVVYAVIAAVGAGVLDGVGSGPRRVVAGIAAAVLGVVGLRMLMPRRRSAEKTDAPGRKRAEAAFARSARRGDAPLALLATTFLLALATPGTLPALLALLTPFGVGSASTTGAGGAAAIGAGVFVGGMGWWLLIVATAARFRSGAARILPLVNGVGGVAMIIAAALAARFAFTTG
jgi:threonine/homoserine/homoserine lactone efflux protein